MALKATVYKAELQLSNLDRGVYGAFSLTLARHPSETEERLMVRLLAFILYAESSETRLEFGRGLSVEDEPALWQRDLTGAIERWIEVGLPDEKLLRRACGRASEVVLLTYGGRIAELWRDKQARQLNRLETLQIINLAEEESTALAALAERNMNLQCSIQDGAVMLTSGDRLVMLHPQRWKETGNGH